MNYNKQFRKDNKGNFTVSKFEFQFGWFFFHFFSFFYIHTSVKPFIFRCWVTGVLINIFFLPGKWTFSTKISTNDTIFILSYQTNWIFSIYFLISTQDLDNDIIHREAYFNPFLWKYNDTNAQERAKTYKLRDGMEARISSRNNKSKEETRSNLPYLPSLMLSSRLCANRSKCNSATNWEKLQIFPWV